jgi:two-component system CheB/CheR fusion protein
LIIEDNVDAGDSLSLLLRLDGYEVLVARSGPTALDVAPAFQPHVVLLDIGLPGMDGYQVAERLRGLPEFKSVLLCALTGHTPSGADEDRPQQAGFDHHFVKPVNLKKLSALLSEAAARLRLSDQVRT